MAYRSNAFTAYASRTNTTISVPSGVVDGDVLLLMFVIGAAGTPATPDALSGWTLQVGPTTVTSDGFSVTRRLYTRIASSEPASYTITHATGSSSALMSAYSSATLTGIVTSSNQGTGNVATATGITTPSDNCDVVYLMHNWDLFGGKTAPAGTTPTFTERSDDATSLIYLADGVLAAAGATGNKTQTVNVGGALAAWGGFLVGLPVLVDAPIITISSPNANSYNTSPVTVSGTASDNGTVNLIEYRINGGTWLTATGTTNWSFEVAGADGEYTVDVRGTDNEANVSTPVSRIFNIGVIDSVTYVAISTSNYTVAQTSVVLTKPTGTVEDDVMIALIATGTAGTNTAPTPTPPSGWTLINSEIELQRSITDAFNVVINRYYKIAGASEPADYTWTHTTAASYGWVITVRNTDAVTPIQTATQQTGTNTTSTAPGATTNRNGSLVIFWQSDWGDSANDTVPPTGTTPSFTERADETQLTIGHVATGILDIAGATGDKSITNNSSAAEPWGAGLIVLQPPAGIGANVTISNPAANASAWNTITVSGTATANSGSVTAIEWSLNQTDWFTATGTTDWTFNLPTQTSGSKTVYVRGTDSSGTSNAVSRTFTVYAFGTDIETENAITGTSLTSNLFSGFGTETTQGFARGFSFAVGDDVPLCGIVGGSQVSFQLFRLGYYGGDLARNIGTITGTPASQSTPNSDSNTRSQNCNNWTAIATWKVPADALPGMYMAKMYRTDADTEGCNILFMVRSTTNKNIGYLTADFTWHLAYNAWGTNNTRTGGRSLYGLGGLGNIDTDRSSRGYYDRPVTTRTGAALTRFWRCEMATIAFLERNGFDVGYISCKDVSETNGSTLLGNFDTLFLSGHNEYWSQEMWDRIETRIDAGMNLVNLSGNTCFWRVLYDSTNRYIECWKETENDSVKIGVSGQTWGTQPTDSNPPSLWTGTWRDNAALATNQPENALLGTIFVQNNNGNANHVFTRSTFQNHRIWANTNVAGGSSTQTFTSLLGFEVDTYKMLTGQGINSDLVTSINAARPPGTILITYQANVNPGSNLLLDDGDSYGAGLYDYGFVLRKTAGGGIVFSTGSMNTSWGLYNYSDGDVGDVTSLDFKQMMINLLAEMGAQPSSLEGTLTTASASGDSTGPTVVITSHTNNQYLGLGGTSVTITGTASTTGGIVANIEYTLNGGTTWTPLDDFSPTSWSFGLTLVDNAANTIGIRGIDDLGNKGSTQSITLYTQDPLTAVGEEIQLIWNIRATVGQNNQYDWGVLSNLSSVGKSVVYIWNVNILENEDIYSIPRRIDTYICGCGYWSGTRYIIV